VEEVEVLAPPDIEERFGLVDGNIFQGEMTPDQLFSLRPIPGYGDYRTPVKGAVPVRLGNSPGRRSDGRAGPERSADIRRNFRREQLLRRAIRR
jgi:hypothetical protein